MSERVLEITKLLAPLLGTILGAIAPHLINRFLPEGAITLNKWGVYTIAGIGGILGTILLYWTYTGNINYWWGVVGFFSAASISWVYMQYFASPFKKFRVTCLTDDEGHLVEGKAGKQGLTANKLRGSYDRDRKRWVCREKWGVWGPYIHLGKGWYRATFRIKAVGLEWDKEHRLFEIDVAAWSEDISDAKILAFHALTTKDFNGTNRYNKFSLVFRVYHSEESVEFRLRPSSENHIITFDYVKLSRL